MKKIFVFILSLSMILLVACSNGDKQLATATLKKGQYTNIMKYYGKDDKITRLVQTNIVENVTEEQKNKFLEIEKYVIEKYNKINGVKYKSEFKGNTYTENIDMNIDNKETLKSLSENNLIDITNKNAEWISLETSLKLMKEAGYEIEMHK